MTCAGKATLIGVLAAVFLAGAIDLSAQSNAEKSVAFVGKWGGDGREFDQEAACGPQHGGNGRCTVPLDKLKPLLHQFIEGNCAPPVATMLRSTVPLDKLKPLLHPRAL